MNDVRNFDVAIVGGGLAGNLLARQLRRQLPDLEIGLFEKAPHTSYKVGESTVELASNYFLRRLGLSRYLYEHQLPKNGLRFFFDEPGRQGDLEALSEIGSVAMPYLPSFQLDRSRFEADLLALNEADGVAIHRGRVKSLELDEAGHRFDLVTKNDRTPVRARWLVDASGRAGVLAKPRSLWVPQDHNLAAVWGRFRGIHDLDDYGSEAFRGRVNHTSRFLSTTHFCYPGYWIWLIPLGQGLTSVGVVIERDRWDDRWRRPEGFEAFLRGHRAVSQLLEGSTLVDVMSYRQLAYGCKRYFGDRWALIGEAAAFTDPFYSPGSDFIALENDFVVDLIRRDLAGEGYAEQRDRYDAFVKFRYDATMLLYQGLYGVLGSYELYNLKWDFDIACYYNLWVEPFMRDQHLEPAWLEAQLRQRGLVLKVLARFSELFRRVEGHLLAEGSYHRRNLGAFTGEFPSMRCAEGLGTDASAAEALDRTAEAFNGTRSRALSLLGRDVDEELPLRHFLSGKPLM